MKINTSRCLMRIYMDIDIDLKIDIDAYNMEMRTNNILYQIGVF